MNIQLFFWLLFIFLAVSMYVIDVIVTDKRKGKVHIKTSLTWSGIWIGTALLYGVLILLFMPNGSKIATDYFTGYLIEESLSVDNLFVFLMIFRIMKVSEESQPHILKWGIISAIVMRIIFILAGVALIQSFHFIIYIFGALLFYAAYKMLTDDEHKEINLEKNFLIRFVTRYFSLMPNYEGKYFFIKQNGKTFVTKTFITLLLIESADLIFAIDSIPAILAITQDSFVIITSNIFAVMGLRSLYFALAGLANLFKYLKTGVAIILLYVGVKMVIADLYKIPTEYSLIIIVVVLLTSIFYSVYRTRKDTPPVP